MNTSARTRLGVCLLLSLLYLYGYFKSNITTTSNNVNATSTVVDYEDEQFTLCNKKLSTKKMPSPSTQYDKQYGVHHWKRDMKKSIVLEPNGAFFGQTGNQIAEFLRAIEMARDQGGALVIHEKGFPYDMTLRLLYLGLNRTEVENRLGVMFYDRVEEKYRSALKTISMKDAYYYISNHSDFNMVDTIDHRHYAIQELYRMTAKEMELHPNSAEVSAMCSSMHALFGKDGRGNNEQDLQKNGITKKITQKYTVVHSRMMSSFGEMFFEGAHQKFGVDRRAGIDLPPDLISSILSPLGMNTSSIVMITDGRTLDPIERLSSDPATAPYFQVVPPGISTPASDIMLAILADVFIGSPVSTFSHYIAHTRYALGIGNSYLFYRRNATTEKFETFCHDEECLQHWINMMVSLF